MFRRKRRQDSEKENAFVVERKTWSSCLRALPRGRTGREEAHLLLRSSLQSAAAAEDLRRNVGKFSSLATDLRGLKSASYTYICFLFILTSRELWASF